MFSFFRKHQPVVVKTTEDFFLAFKKQRKNLLRLSLLSVGLTVLSLAIVGTKLFYPFHMLIGVSIYVLSFVPLIKRIYLSRQVWKKYRAYSWSKEFFVKEWRRLILVFIMTTLVVTFFWLRPLDDKPFADLSSVEIVAMVEDDLYKSVTAMDYLETTGNTLLTALEDTKGHVNRNELVTDAFTEFLQAVTFSESLTDRHRYFADIPYSLWSERVNSFLISYSLYVKKYEIVHRLLTVVKGDEGALKILNQTLDEFSKGGIFNEMVNRFYEPKTNLRLSAGHLYLQVFTADGESETLSQTLLRQKSVSSYQYLSSNFFITLNMVPLVLSTNLEQKLSDTWFPVQKNVAVAMGRAILSTRGKEGIINTEQVLSMQKTMEPGDIMLQRRNWHLSNVGIPGFWTHSALYTGDLNYLNTYFESLFPYQGFADFSEYLEAKLPGVYSEFQQKDSDGQPRSVVEAIEAGVVMQSLTKSAEADFVVVLRPNLNLEDKLEAVVRALRSAGKPYDFDFDFATRDALVCSELIYDAYLPTDTKNGLSFETSIINGRSIVSPVDIAQKFVTERDSLEPSMTFVYFIRSDEKTKKSKSSSVEEFVASVGWSKFSFLQPALNE